MAGEWLKMECSTPDKPEVLALTVRMGWDDPDLTVGKLFRLWRWFDQQTVDGNAEGVTSALLDRQVGVTGFIQAVAEVGWLTITPGGIRLANFEKHNGATAKSRAQTAKRVANHKSNAKDNGEGNAPNVTKALAREEKRRGNTDTDVSVVGGEPPDPADTPTSTVRGMPLPCPKERIAERFSEALPMLPRVKLWPKARESALRSRWGEMLREKRWQTADEGVRWFDEFFRHAAKSDFITGRRKGSGAHAGWTADFDFLIGPKGFTGVREGKYDNQEATA